MNNIKTVVINEILAEQANFCRARGIAEMADLPGNFNEILLARIAKKLGKLCNAYDEEGDVCTQIRTWKNTGIYFNSSIETDIDEHDFTFKFNATLLFVDLLRRSLGDSIFDARFTGYYRNTHGKLKTRYQSMLNKFLKASQTISDKEIFIACIEVLREMRVEAIDFQRKHNEQRSPGAAKKAAERYDAVISTMHQLMRDKG